MVCSVSSKDTFYHLSPSELGEMFEAARECKYTKLGLAWASVSI